MEIPLKTDRREQWLFSQIQTKDSSEKEKFWMLSSSCSIGMSLLALTLFFMVFAKCCHIKTFVVIVVQSLSFVQLCIPMDCSLPGSSDRGIFQARILEWVAISFSRGSSWTKDQTYVFCIGRQIPWGFWTVVLEKTFKVPWIARRYNQSILKEISPGFSLEGLRCWSWNSNTLATWCDELAHLKRPWCWERLRAGGEGDDRGWDGWMASLTQWTWVWVNSGSWWWTGGPGALQSMGLQRVGDNWATELNWSISGSVHVLSHVWLLRPHGL